MLEASGWQNRNHLLDDFSLRALAHSPISSIAFFLHESACAKSFCERPSALDAILLRHSLASLTPNIFKTEGVGLDFTLSSPTRDRRSGYISNSIHKQKKGVATPSFNKYFLFSKNPPTSCLLLGTK